MSRPATTTIEPVRAPVPGGDGDGADRVAPAAPSRGSSAHVPGAVRSAIATGDVDTVARSARAQLGYHALEPAVRSLLEELAGSEPAATPVPDPSQVWLLRRGDGALVAPLRLGDRGFVLPEPHPNEARWSITDDVLTFSTAEGEVTTRFGIRARTRSGPLLAGVFHDGTAAHVLTRPDCGYGRICTALPESLPDLVDGTGLSDLASSTLPERPAAILGAPRTGTHLLINLLNSSREVFFDAELLDYDRISVFGGTVAPRGALGALRSNDPRSFVATMLSRSYHEDGRSLTDVPVRGFKLFPGQSQEVWDWVIDTPEFQIVHVWRRNLLAEYSSLRAAWRSGHWVDVQLDPAELRLDFDEERFGRFVDGKRRFTERLRRRLAERPGGYAEIEYSQLDAAAVGRLLARLTGRPVDSPLSDLGLRKQLPGATLERFRDPERVRRCLDGLGHPEWGESDAP